MKSPARTTWQLWLTGSISPETMNRSMGMRLVSLIVETDEDRGFGDRLSFGHDRICRKAFIRPTQRNAFHDDLIVRYSGVLAHHRRLHDALAVDHGAEPARPGSIDQGSGHGAAIERRIVAAVQYPVVGHDHAHRRVKLTE